LKELDVMPMSQREMSDVKTFRGRTLEAVLPQIREELGSEAIVLRRREGLAGGIGGFFQKSYVEVEARGPLPSDRAPEARNDGATAEGLGTPIVRTLVEQASPFADALARADSTVGARAADVMLAAARGGALAAPAVEAEPEPAPAPARAGLYGPQPNFSALDTDVAEVVARTEPPRYGATIAITEAVDAAPAEVLVAPPALPDRPKAADAAEERLVAAGLSAGLAADVVGEAVTHGMPFATPRALKRLVRTAVARRMPVMTDLGPDRRVIAIAGPGGAGKTSLVCRLAAAYAQADHEVVVVALCSPDGGCAAAATLEPLGVSVIAASDAAQATRRLRHREPLVTLIDTPALGASSGRAAAALATELRALGTTEVHLALPATISAAAADELSGALGALGLTHVALTHTDETARPGAPVELAIRAKRPLSYVSTQEEVLPADPAALAAQLLP
jgi:flagellar biosynthesis GTPase FlhF